MPVRDHTLDSLVSRLAEPVHEARADTVRAVLSSHQDSDRVQQMLIGQRPVSDIRPLRQLSHHCFQPLLRAAPTPCGLLRADKRSSPHSHTTAYPQLIRRSASVTLSKA